MNEERHEMHAYINSIYWRICSRFGGSIAVFLTTFTSPLASASPEADKILKEVQAKLASKDEAARIKMKVVDSNGTSKERELVIKRKSGGKQQVLVRLLAPSDVSGVALLSVAQGKQEDQWIYMPSQKKARRVVSGNRNQRFLDTEFSLEDFAAGTYRHFENKVLKEQRTPAAAIVVIESLAKNNETSYSKILTWVDRNKQQLQKSEYYDRDGKLLKTMVFRDYKKFGSVWRAQTIEVLNVQTKRSTVLKIASLQLNTGLSDNEFTQSALEEED